MLVTINSENAKILRKKCVPYIFGATIYDPTQPDLQEIADELSRVMQEAHGVGVAAPQIGKLVRVFIMGYRGTDLVVVNPRIMHRKGAYQNLEGCLSLPGRIFMVKRALKLTLTGTDLCGKMVDIKLEAPISSIVEHEIDHLDGILIDKKGKEVAAKKLSIDPSKNAENSNKETEYPHLSYGAQTESEAV